MSAFHRVRLATVVLFSIGLHASAANIGGGASLIGDTAHFQLWFPERGAVFPPFDYPFEIVEGVAELGPIGGVQQINVEAFSILVLSQGVFFSEGSGPDPCNCLYLSDLNRSDGAGRIVGIDVSANFNLFEAGFESDDFEFGPDWVNINLSGNSFLGVGSDFSTLTVDITFGCFESEDGDGDGVFDAVDNCVADANPDQRDTDGDGYGNICDADINNDGIVNFSDLFAFQSVFLQTGDLDEDFNGDMLVNFSDLAILRDEFLVVPGPSCVVPPRAEN